MAEHNIAKVAHFLLFALLGGLLYVRQDRGTIWRVVEEKYNWDGI